MSLSPGVLDHLGTRETTFVLASRAPYGKIASALVAGHAPARARSATARSDSLNLT